MSTPMILDRRRFLRAMGLSALAGAAAPAALSSTRVSAGDEPPAKRVIFFCTGHAHVWNGWHVPLPGLPTDRTVERSLLGMTRDELSPVLRPFHAMRDRVLPIEGIAHTTVLGDLAGLAGRTGVDPNHHNLAMAHLLTGQIARQRGPGTLCIGGGRSIDQEIGSRLSAPGRFDACVWGANHWMPYSFLEAGVAAPRVEDAERAYADLLGLYVPPATGATPTRAELLRGLRGSVLDTVAREHELVRARLGTEGARKLEQHRDLVRDLERSLGISVPTRCDPVFEPVGHVIDRYSRLATLALSCDLTRVVTIVPPILEPTDFGYPASSDVHGRFAHSSVDDGSEPFDPVSEQAMIDYGLFYSQRFLALLEMLDSVPEGSGTLLDNTTVVWLTELGSPTHQHIDACTLIAGGTDFFRTGRYVRYARSTRAAIDWAGRPLSHGPSISQLYTTLLRSFGWEEDFGLTEVTRRDGSTIDLRGALPELHA